MALERIDVERFLTLSERIPVVDVRSPSEFSAGHIPGAVSIPLFDDGERAAVGIKYKREGRIPAITEGLRLTGPLMAGKLNKALQTSEEGKLLVHCWRGGMRSEAMAWLFSLGDIETKILDGGYKAYRQYILKSLSEKRKMIVLGGLTGSGKTHIIKYLRGSGQQVLDLEGLANHKGSAFGSLGQLPQPSTEHFENILFDQWNHFKKDLPVWIEDESRNIGRVFIPDGLYFNMQSSPAVILMLDLKTRLPRLIQEYSNYSPEVLKTMVLKIGKRLGGDNTSEAIGAIEDGEFGRAIEITLNYYDKAYRFGLRKKNSSRIIYINSDTDDVEINSLKILEAAGKLL